MRLVENFDGGKSGRAFDHKPVENIRDLYISYRFILKDEKCPGKVCIRREYNISLEMGMKRKAGCSKEDERPLGIPGKRKLRNYQERNPI